MTDLCGDGMFWCAFDIVFGVGAAVIVLIIIAALLGLLDHLGEKP
jgi:hypothetical protein